MSAINTTQKPSSGTSEKAAANLEKKSATPGIASVFKTFGSCITEMPDEDVDMVDYGYYDLNKHI